MRLYPFLRKFPFGLFGFGSVEDVPGDMTEFIEDGHWWMAVKRRKRRVGKEKESVDSENGDGASKKKVANVRTRICEPRNISTK